jgi:RimJ/RimL family protein N-acetyltransferase
MDILPAPQVITTERLVLREFRLDDADRVREVVVSGEPEGLPPGAPTDPDLIPEWLADMQSFRERMGGIHFGMVSRETGSFVGAIGLFHTDMEVGSSEIGYGVRSDQRGNGYATEALAAVSAWALKAGGLQRVWLTANTDNFASVRVAEKAGFHREGTMRRAGLEPDGLHDLALFSLLNDD